MSGNLGVAAVLFDFDGTLADTAADLAYALNLQLEIHGHPPVPLERLRPHVSQGARGMLRIGFGLHPDHPAYPAMREEYLNLYETNLCRESALFPEMRELLAELDRRRLPWGIVTNKLERLTFPLVQALQLADTAQCVVCGDTAARAKPHPDPLFEASRRLNVDPRICAYVGDDERDVQASLAAGMIPVVALYGYLGDGNEPQHWGANHYIRTPFELLNLLSEPSPV
jgi:phosphoglycolate phosphatase